jgi:hypothetical protein
MSIAAAAEPHVSEAGIGCARIAGPTEAFAPRFNEAKETAAQPGGSEAVSIVAAVRHSAAVISIAEP